MSLRGKKVLTKKSKGKKLSKLGKKASGLLGGLSGLSRRTGMPRRRHSRGITSRQFRTAQRVLKRIVKMYSKLPRRAAHHTSGTCGKRR